MGQEKSQVFIRVSPDTRAWLESQAEQNFRTIAAEVQLAIKERRERVEASDAQ